MRHRNAYGRINQVLRIDDPRLGRLSDVLLQRTLQRLASDPREESDVVPLLSLIPDLGEDLGDLGRDQFQSLLWLWSHSLPILPTPERELEPLSELSCVVKTVVAQAVIEIHSDTPAARSPIDR